MRIRKFMIVATALILAFCTVSCGKKEAEDDVIEIPEEQLAPLEEKVTSPALESQVPASDPNSVGNMVYYPNSNEFLGALAGSNTLTLYFEKGGISSGKGRVTIYNDDDYSTLSYVDVDNPDSCRMEPIDNNGVQLSGWEGGTQATLFFPTSFQAGRKYFVLMDAGCFRSGDIESKAVVNPSLMTIVTKPYGIASDVKDKYNFGDTAILSVLVGGDCRRVLVQDYDSSAVLPSQTMMTSSGEIYFTFMKEGTWSFKVSFYDDANEIDSVTYTVDVAGTAGEVKHDSASQIVESSPANDVSVSDGQSSASDGESANFGDFQD